MTLFNDTFTLYKYKISESSEIHICLPKIYDPLLSIPMLERREVDPKTFASKDVGENMIVDDSVLQLELNMTPSTRTSGTPL